MSIRKYTAINIVGGIIPMIVMLVSVPLYLRLLGDARFGVMAILWAILGYFSFFDLGLGKATANRVAQTQSEPSQHRADIVWTALAINFALGLLAALILWFVGHYAILHALKIPVSLRAEALQALPWMVGALPLLLVLSVLNGALEGCNEFFVANSIQVGGSAMMQLVPLGVAVWMGPQLGYVVPAAVVARAVTVLPLLAACRWKVMPRAKVWFKSAEVRPLIFYGGWMALGGIAALLLETFDRVLVGVILGATATAQYVIPLEAAGRLRMVPAAFSRALFPKFSALSDESGAAVNSVESLKDLITPIIVLALVLIEPFLFLWVGKGIASTAVPLALIVLLGTWISSIAYVPAVLLQARGRPDIVAKIRTAELPVFLLVLFFALREFGLLGAATLLSLKATIDAMLMFHFSGMLSTCVRKLYAPAFVVIVTFAFAWAISSHPEYLPLLAVGEFVLILISLWIGRNFWRPFVWKVLEVCFVRTKVAER